MLMNLSGLTAEFDDSAACVFRRASDSSSHYSSVSSRHQLSWSRHQRPADLSPQLGGDRPRRTPHVIGVDELTRQGERHYGCGRQLGLTRQPPTTLTQPSSLSALVEYVLFFRRWYFDSLTVIDSCVSCFRICIKIHTVHVVWQFKFMSNYTVHWRI